MSQPRRRKGEGFVYRRGRVYWISFGQGGQKYREPACPVDLKAKDLGAAEAYKVLQRRIAEVITGTTAGPRERQVTVADLFEAVERDYRLRKLRTLENMLGRWDLNVRPFFAHRRAKEVTNEHIDQYIDLRQKQGATGGTIARELGLLRRAYKLGMRGNPPKVRVMPYFPQFADSKRTGYMEMEQHDAFAFACRELVRPGEQWLEAVFETAFTFGWRWSEIVLLRVWQVRFTSPTAGYIHLEADTTKNLEARDAPMDERWCPRLMELLRELVRAKERNDYVFTRGKNQRPVKRFDKLWDKVCERAGVSAQLLLHDLRRTAARNMIAAGIPESRVMKICGWKTDSMLRRYAIVNDRDLRTEMAKLGEYAERARQGRAEVVKKEEEAMMSREAKRGEMVKHRAQIGHKQSFRGRAGFPPARPASSANMPVVSSLANKV